MENTSTHPARIRRRTQGNSGRTQTDAGADLQPPDPGNLSPPAGNTETYMYM